MLQLNVRTIELDEGLSVSLRLTSKAIGAYLKTWGETGQLPLAVLMRATEEYEPRAALLSGAMKYPDNQNKIKTGDELLDMLSAAGFGWDDVNELIIQLLRDAGFVDDENRDILIDSLRKNTRRVISQFADLLSGEGPSEPENAPEKDEEENPTSTRRK